jgi:capsule polysaccharide export protein KpsE/RkpR
MAGPWTYAQWRQVSGLVARRAQLRRHMDEVEERITADRSAGGQSRSVSALEAKLARLTQEEEKLSAKIGDEDGAPVDVSRVDFRGAGG